MTTLLELPTKLEAAGINVRVMDGWDLPAKAGYWYREPPNADTEQSNPAGHMHHHTASGGYTPNRDKANGYAGLSYQGSERLYQEQYLEDGYEPVYTIANAFPAPISSGAGDKSVLLQVRAGIAPTGRPGKDTAGWYGNTHYWNTEWVLNGTGAPVHPAVWEMMVEVCRIQNELMGWTSAMHLAHGHHTRRKIDLWNGEFDDFIETLMELRQAIDNGYTPPEGVLVDIGRNMQYVKQDDLGFEVEYWQVRIVEVITGVKMEGNSNRTYLADNAPMLTFKVWDQQMTDYLSAWTRRNSYGVGPTERVMIENAWNELFG